MNFWVHIHTAVIHSLSRIYLLSDTDNPGHWHLCNSRIASGLHLNCSWAMNADPDPAEGTWIPDLVTRVSEISSEHAFLLLCCVLIVRVLMLLERLGHWER